MGIAVKKAEFAAHRGVSPSAVSQYIARGVLSPPALRPDGKIDVVIADRQLEQRLQAYGGAKPRIDTSLLRRVVAEIEGLRARRAILDKDISACLARSKAGGLDPRALRETLRRRAMSDEQRVMLDGLVAEYELHLAEAPPRLNGSAFTKAKRPAAPSVIAGEVVRWGAAGDAKRTGRVVAVRHGGPLGETMVEIEEEGADQAILPDEGKREPSVQPTDGRRWRLPATTVRKVHSGEPARA